MSQSSKPKKRNVGQGRFRLITVWNQEFDDAEYARILLLLSMYLKEQRAKKSKPNRKGRTTKAAINKAEGGEGHEQS